MVDAVQKKVVYQEIHNTKTSKAGTLSLQIGKGTPVEGKFEAIRWETGGDYFLNTSFVLDGEEITLGMIQLLSVPYAFYAERSGEKHDLILKDGILRIDGEGEGIKLPSGSGSSPGYSACYVSESLDSQITLRGTAKLENGSFKIVFPSEEAAKIEDGSLVIQLTPLSATSKGLAVVRKNNQSFTVAELMPGTGSYDFDWSATALKKKSLQLKSKEGHRVLNAAQMTEKSVLNYIENEKP